MQTGDVLQGANTIPRRSRPNALLVGVAVLAIAAIVALMVWVEPFSFGGGETRDAVSAVGTAIVHDDPGNVNTGLAPGYAPVHDDAGNMAPAAGTAIVHDDPGNVNR